MIKLIYNNFYKVDCLVIESGRFVKDILCFVKDILTLFIFLHADKSEKNNNNNYL